MSLGQLMAEFKNSTTGGGWVHNVSFSSDGNKIIWVGHDSAINCVDVNTGLNVVKLKTEHLPFLSCIWISPMSFVVAGHSCVPLIYSFDGQTITFNGKLDESKKKEAGTGNAFDRWKKRDQNNSTAESDDTILDSIHQNAISYVAIQSGNKERATKISTSGLDGQLVIWDLNTLTRSMQNLKI